MEVRPNLCRGICGPVAQLGARMNGIHEVTGSIPVWSTTSFFASETEPKAQTGATLASVLRADLAFALRTAFHSPSARWYLRSVR